MPDKIFLCLLILCAIWSHGIIGTLADEETKNSSDFLVRQKRVVSLLPNEDNVVTINYAPHVVIIKHFMRIVCVGNILSNYVVVTSAECVENKPEQYQVISHTSRTHRSLYTHHVIDVRSRIGGHPHRARDGVALLVVNPAFEYTGSCMKIGLHTGALLPGILGTISGWGFRYRGENRGTNHPTSLRSIVVPIISHQDCVNRYRPHIEISERDLCTFHPQRHSGHNDFGAGLVVDGFLAGIFLRSGIVDGQLEPSYPDIFVVLQDAFYREWIKTNIANINAHYNRH